MIPFHVDIIYYEHVCVCVCIIHCTGVYGFCVGVVRGTALVAVTLLLYSSLQNFLHYKHTQEKDCIRL